MTSKEMTNTKALVAADAAHADKKKLEEKKKQEEEFREISYDDMYDSKYNIGTSMRKVIIEICRQIKPGVNLLQISLPAFVLEKRSLLEKITDFFLHHQIVLNIASMLDPEQRFLTVVKQYLSFWYRVPDIGVAKPYNPILGEQFKCEWRWPDSTTTYIAEQVSHHPPISAFTFQNRKKNILVTGQILPKASLYPFGNYASMTMVGDLVFRVCNFDEDYDMTYATVCVRNIFFGTMQMENLGKTVIECKKTGYRCSLHWKAGREVVGKIYKDDVHLYTISGSYFDNISIKHLKKKKSFSFLNVKKLEPAPKYVRPIKEQADNESRRVWYKVSVALNDLQHDLANKYKNELEQQQREIRKKLVDWKPKLFHEVKTAKGGKRWELIGLDKSKYEESKS